jgi:hypothetical protein
MAWYNSLRDLRGDVGNIAKNVSPFLALTPLGIPGSLIAAGLGRAIQPGANLGSILKTAGTNAALGAGMQDGAGLLRSAFNPSSSAAAATYGSGGGGAGAAGASAPFSMGAPDITNAAASAAPAAGGGGGLASQIGNGLKSVGEFAAKNPQTISAGLTGLDPSQRNYRVAQTNALNSQTDIAQQQYAAYKQRMQQLQPLLAALSGQMQGYMNNPLPVAKNPYA